LIGTDLHVMLLYCRRNRRSSEGRVDLGIIQWR